MDGRDGSAASAGLCFRSGRLGEATLPLPVWAAQQRRPTTIWVGRCCRNTQDFDFGNVPRAELSVSHGLPSGASWQLVWQMKRLTAFR